MLMSLLYEQARERPEHPAISYRGERIVFAELVEWIERLASGLRQRGLGPGDAVGLVLPDDPWFVVTLHALTGLGAIVVPVNPAFKQAELEYCFRSAGVSAVISDERSAGVCGRIVSGMEGEVQLITTSSAHGQADTLDAVLEEGKGGRLEARAPEEPFVYQFSSGSTGRPKRVPRTHAQCAAEAASYKALGLVPEDRIFSAIPMFHTWGMGACVFASAASGATVVILEDPQPFLRRRHAALELIERERATVFPGVPFNFRLLAEAPTRADLSSLRLCFSAGTALPRSTFEAFGERFGVLVRQLYGSTETGMIAANLSEDPVATFASVGRPVWGVEIEVVDEDGETLPPGEVGELAVRSPAASDGYDGADQKSREAFRDGRFFTGDLGHLGDDGLLYLEGHRKLLIDVGGFKVDPIEVQDVIRAHPCVSDVIVVGVRDEDAGEETVKAVVVPSQQCDEHELLSLCREQLANFKVPRLVEFRDSIPTSPLGKVLRKDLV
jgi:long-chain acyl-CoA synthetase